MYNFEFFKNKYNIYVKEMSNTEQDARWHSEGDVAIHTKMVINEILNLDEFNILTESEQRILLYAGFFHDISKYETTKKEIIEGQLQITAHNHSKLGSKKTRKILFLENFDFYEREQIVNMVKYHGFPIFCYNKKDARIIELSMRCNTKLLYLLAKADMQGRFTLQENETDEFIFNIEYFKEICISLDCFGKIKNFDSVFQKVNYIKNNNLYEQYNKGSDVFMISGLMGVGKDYYIKTHFKNINIISLDALRLKYKARRNDQKIQGKIIQEAYEQAKIYLRKNESFIWNATNITESTRKKLINLFETYNATIKIIYIEASLKKILKQNNDRSNPIPKNVILDHLIKLEVPTLDESHYVEYVLN